MTKNLARISISISLKWYLITYVQNLQTSLYFLAKQCFFLYEDGVSLYIFVDHTGLKSDPPASALTVDIEDPQTAGASSSGILD